VKRGESNLNWGTQLPVFPFASRSVFGPGRSIVPIKRELHTFLSQEITKWRPDLIIVVERKGTAILRALKDWDEEPIEWPWSKVISSNVVDEMPDSYFRGKRILVFDEMMRTGIHIQTLLELLRARGLWDGGVDNLHVAVFAVHEPVPGSATSKSSFAYDSFYNYLTPTAYERKRAEIVRMLQEAGSLMLDTEHIEVRVRLGCNFNQFLKALRRRAQAIVFHAADERTNITVFYEDDDAHKLAPRMFPKGIGSDRIVKKCRFVERASNEFAVIPICYPSIPAGPVDWPAENETEDLLGRETLGNEHGRFYGVALTAGLQVLKWALKDLAVVGSGNYSISLPQSPDEANSIGG